MRISSCSGASESLYKGCIPVHAKPILLFAQGGELYTCTVTAQLIVCKVWHLHLQ